MRLPKTLLLLALATVTLVSAGAKESSTNELEAALTRQAAAWDVAIVNKDRETIAANMSESFHHIASDGSTADKQGFISNLVSDDLTIEPYTVDEFEIRIYGNTALINGVINMRGSYLGEPFTSHFRYTDVYVKEGDVWRVVNVQTTAIKQAS